MSSTDDLQCEAEPTERVSYRWTCPDCSASRTSWGDEEGIVRRRVQIAVQNHVYATAEHGHGATHASPEDFHPAQHLHRVRA